MFFSDCLKRHISISAVCLRTRGYLSFHLSLNFLLKIICHAVTCYSVTAFVRDFIKRYKAEAGNRLFRTRIVHTTDIAALFKLGNHVLDDTSYLTSASKASSLLSIRAKKQVFLLYNLKCL